MSRNLYLELNTKKVYITYIPKKEAVFVEMNKNFRTFIMSDTTQSCTMPEFATSEAQISIFIPKMITYTFRYEKSRQKGLKSLEIKKTPRSSQIEVRKTNLKNKHKL